MSQKILFSSAVVILFLLSTASGYAQFSRAPIPVDIVVYDPLPGHKYRRPVITIGTPQHIYSYILIGGRAHDIRLRWIDIWNAIQPYSPNFNAVGIAARDLEAIQPGQTVTVTGNFLGNRLLYVENVASGGEGGLESLRDARPDIRVASFRPSSLVFVNQ